MVSKTGFPDAQGNGWANGGAAAEVGRGFSILGEASQAIESSAADLSGSGGGSPGALRALIDGSDERTRHGAL